MLQFTRLALGQAMYFGKIGLYQIKSLLGRGEGIILRLQNLRVVLKGAQHISNLSKRTEYRLSIEGGGLLITVDGRFALVP